MPLQVGDPGLFVCSIPDGGAGAVLEPVPSPRLDLTGRWLVLALCRSCVERTGHYCRAHRW